MQRIQLPIYETLLFHGLPAIFKNDNWVIISPYTDEVIRIPKNNIDDQEIYQYLQQRGVFKPPSVKGPGAHSDHFQLTLITTSDCNLRCRYCFASSGEQQIIMSSDIAFSAVRYAVEKAMGRKLLITFFGGEPSLTDDLIREIVLYTKQYASSKVKGTRFSITTNGVMSQKFVDFLIKENFLVTMSVDGIPEVQDYQRPLKNGGKSSPFVEKTIDSLVKAEKDLMIRSTVTDFSVDHLVSGVKYFSNMGVSRIQYEPINVAGRAAVKTKGKPMKRPSVESFSENLIMSIKEASNLGIGILNTSYMNLLMPSVHFCDGIGGNSAIVSYGGEITTCLEVQDSYHPISSKFVIGRYDKNTDTMVLNSTKHKPDCGIIITDKNQCCKDCFAIYICSGGCPTRNFHITNDTDIVDSYHCQLTKRTLPFVIHLFDEASD